MGMKTARPKMGMQMVSAAKGQANQKVTSGSQPKGGTETPRVGGHTSNRTPTMGVPGGFGSKAKGC